MTSCIIAAIPAETDPVWKISSEKVPHMTVLFLGEIEEDSEQANRIIDAVEHICDTMLNRFWVQIDRRGTLGDDEADVLFFNKSFFLEKIRDARDYMLKNIDIYTAYLNAEQYPSWTPHLTLGYPKTPAKSDDPEHIFSGVHFDKIAVWFGDFVGEEFLLKDDTWAPEVSYSAKPSLKDLMHASNKAWGDFSESDYSIEQWHNACLIHQHEGTATAKTQCKLPIKTPTGVVNKNGVFAAAAALAGARTPINASEEEKTSAAKKLLTLYQSFEKDPPESLKKLAGETLAHHGIKGMKWGVRREKTPATETPKTAAPAAPTNVSTVGGAKVIDITNTSRPSVPSPKVGRVAKPLLIGAAAITVMGLGTAFAAKQMQASGSTPFAEFHRVTNLSSDPGRIFRDAQRVYPTSSPLAISGAPKAIESGLSGLRETKPKSKGLFSKLFKRKGKVYNIVKDKGLKKAPGWSRKGKAFTEEVLIGTIGGISINDLKT